MLKLNYWFLYKMKKKKNIYMLSEINNNLAQKQSRIIAL